MLLEEYLSRASWPNFPPTFSAGRRNCNSIRLYHKARGKIDSGQSRMRTKGVGGRSFRRDWNRGKSASSPTRTHLGGSINAARRSAACRLSPSQRKALSVRSVSPESSAKDSLAAEIRLDLAKKGANFAGNFRREGREFKSSLLHHPVPQLSYSSENRSKSARVRAIWLGHGPRERSLFRATCQNSAKPIRGRFA